LKAVTNTTHTTDKRIAAPSIQPVSPSPSSSPTETTPQTIWKERKCLSQRDFELMTTYFSVNYLFYFISFTYGSEHFIFTVSISSSLPLRFSTSGKEVIRVLVKSKHTGRDQFLPQGQVTDIPWRHLGFHSRPQQ
jgi:hypothetical protein